MKNLPKASGFWRFLSKTSDKKQWLVRLKLVGVEISRWLENCAADF
jgi:hypothetical protein